MKRMLALGAMVGAVGMAQAAELEEDQNFGFPGHYTFIGDCTGCLTPTIRIDIQVGSESRSQRVATLTGAGFQTPLVMRGTWQWFNPSPDVQPIGATGGLYEAFSPLRSAATAVPWASGSVCSAWTFASNVPGWPAAPQGWSFGGSPPDNEADPNCRALAFLSGPTGTWTYTTAVPEPGTLALFAAGVLAVAARRRVHARLGTGARSAERNMHKRATEDVVA